MGDEVLVAVVLVPSDCVVKIRCGQRIHIPVAIQVRGESRKSAVGSAGDIVPREFFRAGGNSNTGCFFSCLQDTIGVKANPAAKVPVVLMNCFLFMVLGVISVYFQIYGNPISFHSMFLT